MGDSVKKSEAMALAATISTLLLIAEAAEAVKQLILLSIGGRSNSLKYP